jgi:hypothetical protein
MKPAERLNYVKQRKTEIEDEDTSLEIQINDLQTLIKGATNDSTDVPKWQEQAERLKRRRFDGLREEREQLCMFIKGETGFQGDILTLYTEAERQNLKGEAWARFMLGMC